MPTILWVALAGIGGWLGYKKFFNPSPPPLPVEDTVTSIQLVGPVMPWSGSQGKQDVAISTQYGNATVYMFDVASLPTLGQIVGKTISAATPIVQALGGSAEGPNPVKIFG